MKKDILIVNTSRGDIINEPELINFLKDNPPIAQEIENRILQNAGVVEKAMMEGEVEPKAKEEKTE